MMVFALVADIFFSSFVLAPIAVTFWWATWESFNFYGEIFRPWYQLGVSSALLVLVALLRDPISRLQHDSCQSAVLRRIYIYFCSVVGIGFWRSEWILTDKNFNFEHFTGALLVSLILLIFLKCICNLNATPMCIALDHDPKIVYSFPTIFNTTNANIWMYLLDCVFSVCVVGTLVVFVWRGVWNLLDMFIYPGQPDISALASLAIGYLLVLITFALQPAMKYLARVMTGIPRIVVVDIYLLFSFCGTVNVWRGVWTLLNVYLLPELQNVSCLITHLSCFLILVLINSSNSILVRGVYLDGQEEGEQCVDFPCYYIRLFFQARQKKKFLNKAERRQKERRKSDVAENLVPIEKRPTIYSNHSETITNVV